MDEEQRKVVGAMELRPGALSPSAEDQEKGVVWFDIGEPSCIPPCLAWS